MRHGMACGVDGCEAPAYVKGYCTRHRSRLQNHGSPTAGRMDVGIQKAFFDLAAKSTLDECIKWPFSYAPNGYPRIKDGYVSRGAHRVMCETVHGPRPKDKEHAAHSCGNRWCINPNHLRWATAKENHSDRKAHGTYPYGERSPGSKLTEEIVKAIRASDESITALAERYKVHFGTVSRIKRRLAWTHI